MEITSNEIVLTEEEISKADKEIELTFIKADEPERWQSYLNAPEEVKNFIRVLIYWPKEKLETFLNAVELERAKDKES